MNERQHFYCPRDDRHKATELILFGNCKLCAKPGEGFCSFCGGHFCKQCFDKHLARSVGK